MSELPVRRDRGDQRDPQHAFQVEKDVGADPIGRNRKSMMTDHPLADMLARAAHEMVEQRFSVTAMVSAVGAI